MAEIVSKGVIAIAESNWGLGGKHFVDYTTYKMAVIFPRNVFKFVAGYGPV